MGAATASAAAAAAIQAVKASGVMVRVEPAEFLRLVERQPSPLIVRAPSRMFRVKYQYVTTYKGLAFFTKASEPLALPRDAEVIDAKAIWVPA